MREEFNHQNSPIEDPPPFFKSWKGWYALVLINLLTMLWIFMHGDKVTSIGELIQIMEIVFDADEMALLGTIIAMWFGSRGNSKAGK